ncbi:hypothetical protein HYV85_03085 [Candidatus Woesearchaeota archaeon]|nr:hypothetical protein [Candidatus Woesearchaeota archaeon]
MKLFLLLRTDKRGFFPLELVFSALGYIVAVAILILILNIPLLDKGKAESSISGKAETAAGLRAEGQLSSYLQTQMPAKSELFAKLDWLKERHDKESVFAGFDVPKAKAFLEKYPDVYSGEDYSGFISALHAIYTASSNEKDDVKEAFKAVTGVMFLRAVGDGRKADGHLFYVLPLGVDFENSDKGKPSAKTSICTQPHYDLCVEAGTYGVAIGVPFQAVQLVPLADSSIAKVEFRYYTEWDSWLPGP